MLNLKILFITDQYEHFFDFIIIILKNHMLNMHVSWFLRMQIDASRCDLRNYWYEIFFFGQKDMLSLSKITLLGHCILFALIYFT